MTPEAKLTNKIVEHLKKLKHAGHPIWWFKVKGGGGQKAGIPDLCVVYFGLSVFLEIKAGNNQPSKLQDFVMKEIQKAEGIAEVVRSVDDASVILSKIKVRQFSLRTASW